MADPEPPETPGDPPLRAVPLEKVRGVRGETKIPVPRSKVATTRAFRRIRADRAAGVLGLVALLVTMWLLFNWELAPEPPPRTYSVRWIDQQVSLPDDVIFIPADATQDAPFSKTYSITDHNVTRIIFNVTMQDDVGNDGQEEDILNFRLGGPEAANLTLVIDQKEAPYDREMTYYANGTVVTPPNVLEVPARDIDEAVAALGDHMNGNDNGTGTWTLTAWFTFVGDDMGNIPPGGGPGDEPAQCPADPIATGTVCQEDPGNNVTVRIAYKVYHVELASK